MATHDAALAKRSTSVSAHRNGEGLGDHPQPLRPSPATDAGAERSTTDEQLAAAAAEALAALVASGGRDAVETQLAQLSVHQLRDVVIALATAVTEARTRNSRGEARQASDETGIDVGAARVCTIATDSAARAFHVTSEQIMSAGRHRAISHARAVAMTAAYRSGLTLVEVAGFFDKDHTSVMYSRDKVVATNPRLEAACSRVVEEITSDCTTRRVDTTRSDARPATAPTPERAALRPPPPIASAQVHGAGSGRMHARPVTPAAAPMSPPPAR